MLFNGLEQPTPIPYLFIRLRDYFSCQYKRFLDWLFHFFGSHEVFSCSIVTYIKKKKELRAYCLFFRGFTYVWGFKPKLHTTAYHNVKELLQRFTLSYI